MIIFWQHALLAWSAIMTLFCYHLYGIDVVSIQARVTMCLLHHHSEVLPVICLVSCSVWVITDGISVCSCYPLIQIGSFFWSFLVYFSTLFVLAHCGNDEGVVLPPFTPRGNYCCLSKIRLFFIISVVFYKNFLLLNHNVLKNPQIFLK